MFDDRGRASALVGLAGRMRSAPFDVVWLDQQSMEVCVFDKSDGGYVKLRPLQLLEKYADFFRAMLAVDRVPILIGLLAGEVVVYASRPLPGRRAEELVGIPWGDLFAPHHVDTALCAVDLAGATGAAVLLADISDPTLTLAVASKSLLVSPGGGRILAVLAVSEQSGPALACVMKDWEAANDN